MKKELTIIVPTYNMEEYLDKCLRSLIVEDSELLNSLEVLVIIDGGTDRSSEIAHRYQKKYPDTFFVIDKKNGNYGSCINCGLKRASGKYVKILDADDSFDKKGFSQYLKLLHEIDTDLIITDVLLTNETEGKVSISKRKIEANKIIEIKEALNDFLNPVIQMHAVTYKTENLKAINYTQTEGISYTDQEWMFHPMVLVNKIYYYPVLVYKYLLGRPGQTMEEYAHIKNISHHIKSNFRRLEIYESVHCNKEIRTYLKTRLLNSFHYLYFNYLVMRKYRLPLHEILEIDLRLRSSPEIYEQLNERGISPKLHYKFIKKWREAGCKAIPCQVQLIAWTYLFLISLKNKIKK